MVKLLLLQRLVVSRHAVLRGSAYAEFWYALGDPQLPQCSGLDNWLS